MRSTSCVPALLLALLCACDEDDAASVRLRLDSGGGGVLHASSLAVPAEAGVVEASLAGVAETRRAAIVVASGRYADINALKVGDITFKSGSSGGSLRWLEVQVPQGAQARWQRQFVPLEEAARLDTVSAFTSDPRARTIGAEFKLVVELPAGVVSQGLAGVRVRGARGESEGSTATLTIPIERSREAQGPVSWQITWSE